MILHRPIKNKDKRKRFAHIGAGIVIFFIPKKYESGHGSYLIFGIAGVVFLTIVLLHPLIILNES